MRAWMQSLMRLALADEPGVSERSLLKLPRACATRRREGDVYSCVHIAAEVVGRGLLNGFRVDADVFELPSGEEDIYLIYIYL